MPGGRRVDSMTGIVVDVIVDGEVVRTESSNRALLNKVLRERRSTASR